MKTNSLQSHPASVSMMLQEHILIIFHFLVSKPFLFIMPSAWYGPRAACAKANGAVQWLVHWCGLYNVQFAGNASFPDLQNTYQSAGNPLSVTSRGLISLNHPKSFERKFGRYLTSFVDLYWTSCTNKRDTFLQANSFGLDPGSSGRQNGLDHNMYTVYSERSSWPPFME